MKAMILATFLFATALPAFAGDSDIATPNTDGIKSEQAKPNVASPNTGGSQLEQAQGNYTNPNTGMTNNAAGANTGMTNNAATSNTDGIKSERAKPNTDGIS